MIATALEDPRVRLELLRPEHVEPLLAAATEDRASYGLAPVPADRDGVRAYVETALADAEARRAVPYAIVRRGAGPSTDAVVGSVRFMSLEWWTWPRGEVRVAGEPRRPGLDPPDVAEIGHAWLAASAQRSAVNTATCAMMMHHAFEVWRVHRLVLKTDARNERSRAAIARLGGHFEGVLRAHLPAADGVVRDTAMFSIVQAEWPGVRSRLTALREAGS